MTKSQFIYICGIGPGHPDYILPAVFRRVAESDLLIGGKRHLSLFDCTGKETIALSNNIDDIVCRLRQLLQHNPDGKQVTLLVSGDTGFHSLLGTMERYFSSEDYVVIPGISSFQYLFAQVGMSYHDAHIASVHGQDADVVNLVRTHPKLFLLTDTHRSWKYIAQLLCDNGLGHCQMIVGDRFSYPDETILRKTARELENEEHEFGLCSVIILYS
ncbi:precorrin-6y C5,15-methyltransferase (decarboxylating) subunit CbiE [Parabacteroides sp. FAFU027]|uniref:precorrin-6y C5,15-methyltransferase (decarboxylating) subunit CbiE n=1 Tax=Parabacteroides sp. FAFU027 TaxID=2922715 RepID=UPI001FAFB6DB|nr:precorrin-6y C5,15-methyltransferase (decarboxylating) subunit CbiE [Parabacteroides sp. FAFU027]